MLTSDHRETETADIALRAVNDLGLPGGMFVIIRTMNRVSKDLYY